MGTASGSGVLTRREWIQAATAAAGGGIVLSACGKPLPTPTARPIHLVIQIDVPALVGLGTVQSRTSLYQEVLAEFEHLNPGVTVTTQPYTATANSIAAITAGEGPDVLADTAPAYPAYVEGSALLQLDPLLQYDSVSNSIWSSTAVDALQTAHGTFGLSRGLDSYVFALNVSLVNSLGLPLPSTDWAHTELLQLAQNLTDLAENRASVSFQPGPGSYLGVVGEVVAGFSGTVTNAARTVQTLSTGNSLTGMEWLFNEVLVPGIGALTVTNNFQNRTAGIQELQQVDLLSVYSNWTNFQWVLYPPPTYPSGRSGSAAVNWWGISSTTKHSEQAWALLRWITTQPTFQRLMMKAFLLPPALNSLNVEWVSTVEGVEPGLSGKGVHWFADSAESGWGHAVPWFAYNNTTAATDDGDWFSKILAGSVQIQLGLAAADQQVNAVEAAGPQPSRKSARTSKGRSTAAKVPTISQSKSSAE